jgi:hypothetical protein
VGTRTIPTAAPSARPATRGNMRFRISRASFSASPTICRGDRRRGGAPPRRSRRCGDASHDAALIEGVKATQRMLEALLTRFGVQKIEALGKTFDPTKHEAMFEVEDPTQAPGTIVQVMEDGYTIHDRLLRPARVIVVVASRCPCRS